MSVINIPESPEMIELSSNDTEKESWSFGSETSNNNDLYYKTRGWNKKRKQEKELDVGGCCGVELKSEFMDM